MNASPDTPQRIARLTPLPEVHAAVERLAMPVAARGVDLAIAAGRVLAADVVALGPGLTAAVALRDGWAVRSDLVADAGPYAPVPVSAAWVEVGDPLPADTDAVLAPDAVTSARGVQEAAASAAPGEGALRAFEGGEGRPLRHAGDFVRAVDLAAFRAVGVSRVALREPLVLVVSINRQVASSADAAAPLIASAVEAAGGRAHIMRAAAAAGALESALHDGSADAVIAIGGTGQGRGDRALAVLAAHGTIAVHGVGIRPGETAALGDVGGRPVLMLPGRLDAALAAWLLIGGPLLRRLTGAASAEASAPATLARKITSTVGLAEVVLVRRTDAGVEPVAAGVLPVQAIAQADGWVLVPPDSEGYPAGAEVELRPLP